MKRLLTLAIALLLAGNTVFAQDDNNDVLKNKKGEVILPQAGDYAIGVSATPFINLVGNLFKINSAAPFNNPLAWNFVDATNAIYGKYFVNENTAYRFAIRLGTGSRTMKNYVVDDNDANETVLDKWTHKSTNVTLFAGLEKRKGHGRLQAFYGAGGYLMFAGATDIYTYGNEMTSSNVAPTSTVWTTTPPSSTPMGTRTLLNKEGKTIGLGVRGFVGVEYFVLPKVSLGGEFGYGLGVSMQGDGLTQTESYDATASEVKTTDTKTGGSFSLGMDNDNFGGIIYLMFHF